MTTSMKFKTRIVDWDQISKSIDKICKDMIMSDVKIDSVIGLSRGGLIPAVMLANQLGVRQVYSYGLKSYSKKTRGDIETYQHVHADSITGDNIIVVDDISDKGETMGYVKRQLCSSDRLTPWKHKNIHTCTLCIKEHTDFLPTWYDFTLESDEWVIFPWETDENKVNKKI